MRNIYGFYESVYSNLCMPLFEANPNPKYKPKRSVVIKNKRRKARNKKGKKK